MGQKVIHNILSKGLLNLFNLFLPLAVIPYVYRVLTPEYIGKIEYAATIYTYFSIIGMLGIYNYGLREISSERQNHNNVLILFRRLFSIGFVSNLCLFVILLIFIYFIKDSILRYILIIQSFTLIAQIFNIEWMNEAYEEYKFITIKTIIIRSISFLSIFLFIKNNDDYLLYVSILLITTVVNYCASFLYVNKNHPLYSRNHNFKNENTRKVIPSLFLILFLNNSNILYTMLDRTMLGITDSMNVAYYSIGQKISEMSKAFLLITVLVTIPRMSNYLKEEYGKYLRNIQSLISAMLLVVIPISFGLFLLSEEIVLIFAGDQYILATPAVRIFSIRLTIIVMESILYNQIIFLHKKEKTLLLMNIFCGIINLILKLILIKKLSPELAILTTLISEVIFHVLCISYIYFKLNIVVNYFKRENILFILLPISFSFIIPLVRSFSFAPSSTILISTFICSTLYLSGLLIFRNQIAINLLKQIINNIR